MIYLLLLIVILAIIFGPQYWAKHILEKYSQHREDIPGTGGELVEHLKKKFKLENLTLESTLTGDHYDPSDKAVRLSENNLNSHSLTAVAVAAHEFGHALQDAENYPPLANRSAMVKFSFLAEKVGSMILLVLPLLSFSPLGAKFLPIMMIVLILSIGISTVVHLITLPVEFDASFGRALPILTEGQYVNDKDLKAIRTILSACAMTYLASSLAGLLNFWRWLRFLRR